MKLVSYSNVVRWPIPVITIAFVLSLAFSAYAQQTSADCFEIKHLDLFGLDKVNTSWPANDIDQMLKLQNEGRAHSYFLVPLIVKQLADYHSCKKSRIDTERYAKLEKLYLNLRPKIANKLDASASSRDERLDIIRQDFYDQVNNDEMLHRLIYTMDDGPFVGEDVKSFPEEAKPISVKTKFGLIKLVENNDRVTVGAFDKNDHPLWIKILTGVVPKRYLRSFDHEKLDLKDFEAASILKLFADGERLQIYFRPDGRFLFYTHSW